MPAVARHPKAVDAEGSKTETKRRLYKFKNFLYKTVNLGNQANASTEYYCPAPEIIHFSCVHLFAD
jgi:hypothetical protein